MDGTRKYMDVLTQLSILILKLISLWKQDLKSIVSYVMSLLLPKKGSILHSEYIYPSCGCVLNWNPPSEYFPKPS